ncbi:MAG: AMP-binding enzyme [Promethearchaeia archaeon]
MDDVFRKGDVYFNTGTMLKLHKDKWVSFADIFGDTYRQKSENISTLEIESILNSHPAIAFSAAYSVKIPNTKGISGMASIKLNKSIRFDINEFSKFVLKGFPSYAIPLFIRFKEKFELTGLLKIKKISLQKEAYDLSKIKDPIYFWNSLKNKYEKLTPSIYEDIKSGKIYF